MQPTQRVIVLLVLGLAACGSKDSSDEGNPPAVPPSNVTTGDAAIPNTQADGGAPSASNCPITRPAEQTVCQVSTALCSYDEIECRCPTGVWSCMEPVHPGCPAAPPASGSSCTLPDATECDYLQQECECLAGVWTCEAEGDAGTGAGLDGGVIPGVDGGGTQGSDGGADAGGGCPQARPAELTTCLASSMTCTYESTECVCPDGLWSCSEPVDVGCPATTPLHGDPCAGFADCDFLEVECECVFGSWSCKPND